jgi:hypothetical protein
MQPPLGCDRQTALLGDGDEIAKVSQLHKASHACGVWKLTYKAFFCGAIGS